MGVNAGRESAWQEPRASFERRAVLDDQEQFQPVRLRREFGERGHGVLLIARRI